MRPKDLRKGLYILLRNHQKSLITTQEPLCGYIKKIRSFYAKKGKSKVIAALEKLPRPTEIKIDTIGCFLFGSSHKNYGSIQQHNSPIYYQALASTDRSTKQIWIVGENGAVWLNQGIRYKTAYFFVDSDFKKFSLSDYEKIKQAGVTSCSFYSTKNSKHYPRNDLEFLGALPDNEDVRKASKVYKTLKSDSGTLAFVVLILIVLITAVYVFKTSKKWKSGRM